MKSEGSLGNVPQKSKKKKLVIKTQNKYQQKKTLFFRLCGTLTLDPPNFIKLL
jgi:hypothetical protein